jgi:uncharacterized protein YybS (DUF2232 family)
MKFPVAGSIQDIIKGSVATLALFLAYVSLPLAGMLAGLFAPLPGAFYTLKSGKGAGLAIVLVSAVVLALVSDVTTTVFYLLQCAVISLVLPLFLRRNMGGARALASTTAVSMLLVVAAAATYGIVNGVDLHGLVQKGIETSIAQTAALYEKSGFKGEDLKSLQEAMTQAGAIIGRIYPALVIVGLATIAGVTLFFLQRLARRLPQPLEVGDFRQFRNPEQLVWVLIVAGFAMLVPNSMATAAALNVLIVILSLYFMQGMAVIAHFFKRFATPPFVRVLFYLFLGLQPYLAIAVTILGLFDLWGNFRTPKTPENL